MNLLIIKKIFNLFLVGIFLFSATDLSAQVRFTLNGVDASNSHHFVDETTITKENISNLQLKWTYNTDPGNVSGGFADLDAAPAFADDTLYFGDINLTFHAVDADTGVADYTKFVALDWSTVPFATLIVRSTPLIVGDDMYVFGGMSFLSKILGCDVQVDFVGCFPNDGTFAFKIDRATGNFIKAVEIDPDISSRITAHPVLHDGKIIIATASHEETLVWQAFGPDKGPDPYECCQYRGRVVALDLDLNILWTKFLTPGQDDIPQAFIDAMRAYLAALPVDHPRYVGLNDPLPLREGFYGVSVWGQGNPPIDVARNRVYIGTANNIMVPEIVTQCQRVRAGVIDPPDGNIDSSQGELDPEAFLPQGVTCDSINEFVGNHLDSIVALDIDTGEIDWVRLTTEYDSWTIMCSAHDEGTLHQSASNIANIDPDVQTSFQRAKDSCSDPNAQGADDDGFGSMPSFLKAVQMPNGETLDLLAGGNKDGAIYIIDAETGGDLHFVRKQITDFGTFGGFGMGGGANDGEMIYFGGNNSTNTWRDIQDPLISAVEDPDNLVEGKVPDPRLQARNSGPRALTTLINPPPDVFIDADVRIRYLKHCHQLKDADRIARCEANPDYENVFGLNPFRRDVKIIQDWRDKAPGEAGSPNTVPNPAPLNVASADGVDKLYVVRDLNDCGDDELDDGEDDHDAEDYDDDDDDHLDPSTCQIKTLSGFWLSMDPATAEVLWMRPTPASGFAHTVMMIANGILYAGSTGEEELFVDERLFPGGVNASPSPKGGSKRYAIDAATGEILFRFADLWGPDGDYPRSSAVIVDGVIYWGGGFGDEITNGRANGNTFNAFELDPNLP